MRYFILFLLLSTAAATLQEVTVDGECDCACNEIDRDKLGRSTWYLLHEIAKHADELEDPALRLLLRTLGVLYPCPICRQHINEYIENHRVEVSEKWMCDFHNSVNERLNKTLVDCDSL